MGSLSRLGNLSGRYFSVISKPVLSNKYRNAALFHTTTLLNVKGQEIKMPSLSPTMTDGTIVKWMKKEGDAVAPGDVLCDIQTDKAVLSLETDEAGILAKILIGEDAKGVKVGTLIALMVAEDEDWKSVELPDSSSTDTPTTTTEPVPEAAAGSGPPVTVVNMPSLSPTMTEGTIVKWHKREGDAVEPGDALCDIQTDKAVMSLDTEESGILAKILMPDDSQGIKIGTMIALIVAEGDDWKSAVAPVAEKPPAGPAAASSPAPSAPPASAPSVSHAHGSGNYGPAVRSLLEIYQINASSITPSGRGKKILKSDVLDFIQKNNLQKKSPRAIPPPTVTSSTAATGQHKSTPKPAPGAKYIDIELSNIRKVIAKRLSQSKQEIPHAYGSIQCNIDNLLALRKNLQKDGVKVSVNDVVIKAVAAALQVCPEVNAVYNNGAQRVPDIDISIAVATDNGLITPIVRSAGSKTIADISRVVRELAGKARDGKLKPDEFQGGSFTISNLGMFGITEFSAIINPPQVAILAVGGGITRLDANLQPKTDLRATLSFDARAISDAEAARFLQVLREFLEEPSRIVTGIEEPALDQQAAAL